MMHIVRRIATTSRLITLNRAAFGLLRFPLPDLGQKIKEGRVKKLYVKEGDKVDEFQKIADVQSDKQFTEITSPESGTIKKLHYNEDEVCGVGDIFLEMDIAGEGQGSPPAPEKASQQQEKQEPPRVVAPVFEPIHMSLIDDGVLASATVRMYARQHNIDLKTVPGTGRKGRVLKEDILGHIDAIKSGKIAAPPKAEAHSAPQPKIVPQAPRQPPAAPYKVQMDTAARQMVSAVTYANSIPHLYFTELFDLTELVKISQNLSKHHKTNISPLSLLVKCFSRALLQFPRINSTYSLSNPFNFTQHLNQNLLINTLQGESPLSMQLITDLQSLTALHIEHSLQNATPTTTAQAQNHSTICLTNIGEIGTNTMNPLILHQTTTHATVGSIRTLPHPMQPRQVAQITLGCDHRVIDGATAARFTSLWRSYAEDPNLAFVHMT